MRSGSRATTASPTSRNSAGSDSKRYLSKYSWLTAPERSVKSPVRCARPCMRRANSDAARWSGTVASSTHLEVSNTRKSLRPSVGVQQPRRASAARWRHPRAATRQEQRPTCRSQLPRGGAQAATPVALHESGDDRHIDASRPRGPQQGHLYRPDRIQGTEARVLRRQVHGRRCRRRIAREHPEFHDRAALSQADCCCDPGHGGRLDGQSLAELDERAQQRLAFRVLHQLGERAVDLQRVNGELLQVGEGRVAGAQV